MGELETTTAAAGGGDCTRHPRSWIFLFHGLAERILGLGDRGRDTGSPVHRFVKIRSCRDRTGLGVGGITIDTDLGGVTGKSRMLRGTGNA